MGQLQVPVMMGRWLNVTGTRDGVARVSFAELCATEKSTADYKALAECFISFQRLNYLYVCVNSVIILNHFVPYCSVRKRPPTRHESARPCPSVYFAD